MTAARDEILARIRAIPRAAAQPASRAYRRSRALEPAELVERFCERVADYRADVRRVTADSVAAAVTSLLNDRGAVHVGVPVGLPAEWRPRAGAVEDESLSIGELDALDGAVTGCTVAIAETGTIVLAGGPNEGRRALTLVPDLHVCLVRDTQIVAVLPEAIDALHLLKAEHRPLTFVSGPSATSDIELSRVEGVHGPRDLVVVVVTGTTA